MKKTYKTEILSYIRSLGVPVAGVAGDGATYSKVVCLFPYFTGERNRGNLSMYAYGKDYHTIVKAYLLKIAGFICAQSPESTCTVHVDIGDTDDKHSAFSAGLGFYGKNTLLIHPKYGSYVFIGYVKTDLVLKPDTPMPRTCADCRKCEAACPGGALKNGKIDVLKCVSHISQKKGSLCENEAEIMKKSGFVWGCDICQSVCPHNASVPLSPIPEFHEDLQFSISALPQTNKEFIKAYGDRAYAWRGKAVLKRNLEIFSMHQTEDAGHTK